jgi:protein-disulfide isomerase
MDRTVLATLMLMAVILLLAGTATGSSHTPEYIDLQPSIVEDEPSYGPANASLTIVVYLDLGCPWCAELAGSNAAPAFDIDADDPLASVREDYTSTGEVHLVLKDYPPQERTDPAHRAHRAANCVLEQGDELYWTYLLELYEQRERWLAQPGRTIGPLLMDIAAGTGASRYAFWPCYQVSNGTEIDTDREEIEQLLGPIGTPTILIGNRTTGFLRIQGSLPYNEFQDVIEAGLGSDQNLLSAYEQARAGARSDLHASIKLDQGWNLLSTPRTTAITTVLGDCSIRQHDGGIAWTYHDDGWHRAGQQLARQRGYYIYAEQACNLTVGNTDRDYEGPEVTAGWTMISGSGPIESREGTCEFLPYDGERVWRYEDGDWTHPDRLEPQQGYFVYVKDRCTLG